MIKRYYTSILRHCKSHCFDLEKAEEVIILRFGEQLEFWEIAKVMNCNIRIAQSRVWNALKIMRKEQENGR